jgi:hypothetical protein
MRIVFNESLNSTLIFIIKWEKPISQCSEKFIGDEITEIHTHTQSLSLQILPYT